MNLFLFATKLVLWSLLERIMELTHGVPGVRRCDDISIRDYGTHRAISLAIQVRGDLTVEEAHRIATKVKRVVTGSSGPRRLSTSSPPGGMGGPWVFGGLQLRGALAVR